MLGIDYATSWLASIKPNLNGIPKCALLVRGNFMNQHGIIPAFRGNDVGATRA